MEVQENILPDLGLIKIGIIKNTLLIYRKILWQLTSLPITPMMVD